MKKDFKLGLCPIGKFVFSHEDAMKYKKEIEKKLKKWGINFANIDAAVKDGMVRGTEDIEPAIKSLKNSNVDALFLPHCNFGTEHAAGLIARDMGLPVLIWGPRDEAPLKDGKRLRDSLCGMFASTKVIYKLKVPFTYIENCRIDDPKFEQGLDNFIRAANVVKTFRKGIRVGLFGQRIDFFWSTIINESELLEKFKIEVLPIDMLNVMRKAKNLAEKNKTVYLSEIKKLRSSFIIEDSKNEALVNILTLRDQILEEAAKNKVDAVAVQDFMSIVEETGAWCMLATSFIAEKYPYGLESDVHGAISNLILRKALFDTSPPFLVDITARHPKNDNGVLMWHCGAPLSLCHPDEKIRVGKHWILKGPYGGMCHFRLKDGDVTMARFDGELGEYKLAVGEGHSINGPHTLNNYVWVEVDDWPRWERTLMEGPFPHHTGMIYGYCSDTLVEACKYIPGLSPVKL